MWQCINVEIVRILNPNAIGSFDDADAKDGIFLNHGYFDMRGYSIADAQEIVALEEDFLHEISATCGDHAELEPDPKLS